MASRDYPPRESQSYHRDPRMAKANSELRGRKPSPVRNVEMRRTHEMNAKGPGLKQKYTCSDAGNRHSPERPGSQKRTGHVAIGPWGETKDYNNRPNLASSSRGSEQVKRGIPPGRINRAPRGQPANKLSNEGTGGIRPRGTTTGKPNVAGTGSASNKRYSPGAGSSVPNNETRVDRGTRREVPSRDYSQPGPSAPYAPTTIQSSGPTVLVLERTDDALKASSGKRSWSKERPGCPEGVPGESATVEPSGAGHGSVKDDSGDESDSSGSSSGSCSSSSSCESGCSSRASESRDSRIDDFDKDENITPEATVGTTVSESRNYQDARAESESARPESPRAPEDTVSASTPAPFSADTRTIFYVPDPQRTWEDAVSASNRAPFSADTRAVCYVPDPQRTTQEDAVSASNRENEFSDRESPDAASSLARSDPVCDADATASEDARDTRVVGAPSCSESSLGDEIDRDSLDLDVEDANSYQDSNVSKAAHLRLPKPPLTDTKLALGVPEPDRFLPLRTTAVVRKFASAYRVPEAQ
ncbi:hypothetical protein KUCAC02_007736 [Chaenocephalus aceratus]|uniref:Uncharacterized protein n=1 Tax=Chaenocephalus aceratus TaxID=36190 RepID=A0ACB9X8E4_CHAAC|nr:hypothetical protein KUCAC02_007736 [Chaenocephalus aceratus]